MKISRFAKLAMTVGLAAASVSAPAMAQQSAQVKAQPGESDNTLRAMRDEMERSRTRLRISELDRPFFIEYRLVDVEVRAINASFGALVSDVTTHNRLMAVDVRVGDYRLDSSNFISNTGFQGFIGSTGTVGIDGDYESLRQDLWLATDQAYKEALDAISSKRAFLQSLARPPDIADFSREQPVVLLEPRARAELASRNWPLEARIASSAFRDFPQFYNSRVLYYLVSVTQYLLNSEGSQIRITRSQAAIEAAADTQADDGMRLHNFTSIYRRAPAELPDATAVRSEVEKMSKELLALRVSRTGPDYAGPVLIEAPAAASLMAQMLPASISGARPPLSMVPIFEQIMERSGARSEWIGRMGTRVLPAGINIIDDPLAKDAGGKPLLGSYEVDEEGVRAQRVAIVEDGTLKTLLMSRRPGVDVSGSNGHGRAAFLADPRPAFSNLYFQAQNGVAPEALRRQFLDLCKAEGREWCVVVKKMDNPVLGALRQEDASDLLGGIAAGAGSGDRAPLIVYKVYVSDGHEEMMRGSRIAALTLRSLRRIAGVGSDAATQALYQNLSAGIGGSALSAFGSAQGGLPSTVTAPSLLLEDVEVRGARGEPRRAPLVPAPPLADSAQAAGNP